MLLDTNIIIFKNRHLGPEALAFAEATLSAGAQPTKVRKLLQDKYGANLISKDLVNIKQTLTGEVQNEKSCHYKNFTYFTNIFRKVR